MSCFRFSIAMTTLETSPSAGSPATKQAFRPGERWLDEAGIPINAHGGGILFHEGIHYWYGEHKIAGPAGNCAQVGVHVYSSDDLLAWRDRGIALEVSTDPASEITAGCILERPKVLFNSRTGKFVMWFHLEPKGLGYDGSRSGVAVADRPEGPFLFLRSLRRRRSAAFSPRPACRRWTFPAAPGLTTPSISAFGAISLAVKWRAT
jgi:hypothetical protein